MNKFILTALLILLIDVPGFALPSGAIQLLGADLRQFQSGSNLYTCGKIGASYLPGILIDDTQSIFLTYADKIKALKRKLKSASSSQEQKITKSIKKFKGKKAAAEPLCAAFNYTGDTNPAAPNFDSLGNVTSAGKIAFGIPSQFSANVTTGRNYFEQNCTGCHTDQGRLNRSFSSYRSEISQAPMFFSSQEIPDAMLAQITAYLNRFRP